MDNKSVTYGYPHITIQSLAFSILSSSHFTQVYHVYTQENKRARVLFVKGGASVAGDPLLALSLE